MYHFKGTLTIGQINRFTIEIKHDELPQDLGTDYLAIRVRNTTSALMRPNVIAGPYVIYTSIREQSYNKDTALGKGEFPPHFDANVKTNCSRWQKLPIRPSSEDKGLKSRVFELDVVSQIIFSPSATTYFEVTIARNKEEARQASKSGRPIDATTPGFDVRMQDTDTIWHMPAIPRDHPGHRISNILPTSATNMIQMDVEGGTYDHLVVLTHGIHANLTSDMLYLKETIEKVAKANGQRVICKGFANNSSNTERGVKWLATNVGEWVLRETGWQCQEGDVHRTQNPYKKISFISHSLGGLVQIYVVGYLQDKTKGRIFAPELNGLEPVNFVTLASPWLGISAENPAYVKMALDFGLIGKTGQDLALTPKPLGEYKIHDARNGPEGSNETTVVRSKAPLLSLLSRKEAASHVAIRMFKSRTVYANIENDGIVPLRTSSLFFLDWQAFSVEKAKVQKKLQERSDAKSDSSSTQGKSGQIHAMNGSDSHQTSSNGRAESPHSSGSSSDGETQARDSRGVPPSIKIDGNPSEDTAADHSASGRDMQEQSTEPTDRVTEAEHSSAAEGQTISHRSPIRSIVHALNFTSLIRRASGNGPATPTTTNASEVSGGTTADSPVSESPRTDQKSQPQDNPGTTSGPSEVVENASHANAGLLGLLKPNQSHRKPSKTFARTQTVSKVHTESDGEIDPEEPTHVGFFRSLESVLNPPMPALEYLTDPSLREPVELVIVHDRFYAPEDIPPLKELPRRSTVKNQSRSAKKAEEHERVQLEKVKLEEKIARGWHADMVWRKVLVKLPPDAHNNISKCHLYASNKSTKSTDSITVVRRAFANSHGWPVIDHLAEHHFGKSAKRNEQIHDEGTNKAQSQGSQDPGTDSETEDLDADVNDHDDGLAEVGQTGAQE